MTPLFDVIGFVFCIDDEALFPRLLCHQTTSHDL